MGEKTSDEVLVVVNLYQKRDVRGRNDEDLERDDNDENIFNVLPIEPQNGKELDVTKDSKDESSWSEIDEETVNIFEVIFYLIISRGGHFHGAYMDFASQRKLIDSSEQKSFFSMESKI